MIYDALLMTVLIMIMTLMLKAEDALMIMTQIYYIFMMIKGGRCTDNDNDNYYYDHDIYND